MILRTNDDLDPAKIADCGQTFRALQVEEGLWRFVTGREILYMRETEDGGLDLSCDEKTWRRVWAPYFDMERDYARMRASIRRENAYTADVCEAGAGIRILRQDRWETLVTFIISQRRSIPAIRTAVENICRKMGEAARTEHETVYLFPSPEALLEAGPDVIRDCGVGYRLPYIIDAAERAASGALDLAAAACLPDDELIEALKEVKGVGVKVANCVALFAYGRMACAPVDVWIARAIDAYFGGRDPFTGQGELAGLLQQYMFYYAQQTKKDR